MIKAKAMNNFASPALHNPECHIINPTTTEITILYQNSIAEEAIIGIEFSPE